MKLLSVVRHGKATDAQQAPVDFDRPLLPRGQKESLRAAQVLANLETPVDLILSSPAQRAKDTAEIIAAEVGYTNHILWNDTLYDASAATLLRVLQSVPEDAHHVVLIGHNPSLQELVSGLCAGSTDRLRFKLATSGVAHLSLEIFWWQQIRWGCGQLELLVKPKVVRK